MFALDAIQRANGTKKKKGKAADLMARFGLSRDDVRANPRNALPPPPSVNPLEGSES